MKMKLKYYILLSFTISLVLGSSSLAVSNLHKLTNDFKDSEQAEQTGQVERFEYKKYFK